MIVGSNHSDGSNLDARGRSLAVGPSLGGEAEGAASGSLSAVAYERTLVLAIEVSNKSQVLAAQVYPMTDLQTFGALRRDLAEKSVDTAAQAWGSARRLKVFFGVGWNF